MKTQNIIAACTILFIVSCASTKDSKNQLIKSEIATLEKNIQKRTYHFNHIAIPRAQRIMAMDSKPADWNLLEDALKLDFDSVGTSFWESVSFFMLKRELPKMMEKQRLHIEDLNDSDRQRIKELKNRTTS